MGRKKVKVTPICAYKLKCCMMALRGIVFIFPTLGIIFIVAYSLIEEKIQYAFLLPIGAICIFMTVMFTLFNSFVCCELGCKFFWKFPFYSQEQIEEAQRQYVIKKQNQSNLSNNYSQDVPCRTEVCVYPAQQPVNIITAPVVVMITPPPLDKIEPGVLQTVSHPMVQ